MRGYPIPATPSADNEKSSGHGATLPVDEIKSRIESGDVAKDDLSLKERELYAEELKKARKY